MRFYCTKRMPSLVFRFPLSLSTWFYVWATVASLPSAMPDQDCVVRRGNQAPAGTPAWADDEARGPRLSQLWAIACITLTVTALSPDPLSPSISRTTSGPAR